MNFIITILISIFIISIAHAGLETEFLQRTEAANAAQKVEAINSAIPTAYSRVIQQNLEPVGHEIITRESSPWDDNIIAIIYVKSSQGKICAVSVLNRITTKPGKNGRVAPDSHVQLKGCY